MILLGQIIGFIFFYGQRLAFIVATIAFAYALILFGQNIAKIEGSVIVAAISSASVVLVGFGSHYFTRKREIEALHINLKRDGLIEVIDFWFDLLLRQQLGEKPMKNRELMKRMLKIKKTIMLWGSSDLVDAWHSFEAGFGDETTDEARALAIGEFMLQIRTELGHSNKGLLPQDLINFLLKHESKLT